MQLGFENKKQTMWAAVLGVVALLALAYEVIPFFTGSSTQASSAEIAAPVATVRDAVVTLRNESREKSAGGKS